MAPSLSRGGQKKRDEGGRARRFGLARLWTGGQNRHASVAGVTAAICDVR